MTTGRSVTFALACVLGALLRVPSFEGRAAMRFEDAKASIGEIAAELRVV